MGIDYSARFMYGTDYDSLVEVLGEEKTDELLDNGDLETASPSYDSARDEQFIGVSVGSYFDESVDVFIAAMKAKGKFREIVGPDVEGSFQVQADIY